MKYARTRIIIALVLASAAAAFAYSLTRRDVVVGTVTDERVVATEAATPDAAQTAPSTEEPVAAKIVREPISDALSRITKKPFGLKVSPADSPVSPEKFSGYHVGVDFETTADEQDIDVPVHAFCDGDLLLKKRATGYGGVAVQSCMLAGKDVTVIYGHLKLESVTAKVGDALRAGDTLGFLGKGYSSETDGERKHLHLGIHVGTMVDIRGYVQSSAALNDWLDARNFLKR